MFVEEGYWNYYMSFQVRSNADVLKSLRREKFCKYGVASYFHGDVLLNKAYGDIGDEIIKTYINTFAPVLEETGDAIKAVHGYAATQTSFISLLNPIKLSMSNGDAFICPLFMYLMNSGLGVLKLRVPLLDLEFETFKSMPLKKWYQSASLLYAENSKLCTASFDEPSETVADITGLLQFVIKGVFGGCLISENMNLCFESILLSKTQMPNILSKNLQMKDLRDVYHICFPEESMQRPSDSEISAFWRDKHDNIGGISFVKGVPARLVLFTDVDSWLAVNDRDNCKNSLEYLENSVQYSFDLPICIALMKKINEMNLFYASDNNYHKINYNNAVYCLRENELDAMMDLCPINSKRVYRLVSEIMNSSIDSYENRVDRLFKLERYSKNIFEEKRNMVFESLALCGTTVFGLPAIRDTLTIIRNIIFPLNIDHIKNVSVNGISFLIWGGIIVCMLCRVIYLGVQYKVYKF